MEYHLRPATHIQRRPDGGPTVEYRLRPATHIQRRPDVVVLSGIEWWIIMSSNVASLVVDKSGAATSALTQLPGTFLGTRLGLGVR